MRLNKNDLEFSFHRKNARYTVHIRYNHEKEIKEIEINPVTDNGHYPLDRTYKIHKHSIERIVWDDEMHGGATKHYSSLAQIPEEEHFKYLDEDAYDGQLLRTILKGAPLEKVAKKFQEISLYAEEIKV